MIKEVVSTKTDAITPEEVRIKSKPKDKENLKQRAYLNTLSSIIDYAGTQITGFIVSPFIVGGLGSSMYGIWQMLGQMTGYAKMADSRATQALKWTVAKKKGIASDEELRSDLTSALYVTFFSMPFMLIIGGIISWYAPFITNAAPEYHDLIRITCALLNFSLVIGRIFDIYECVLRGMNLDFKRMGFRAALVVAGGILKVLAITLGFGIIGLSVVQILITVITGLTFYFIVKKNVGWLGFGETNFKKVVQFGKLSGWNMANTTTLFFLTHSDKILLGFLAGSVLVSSYALTMFLPLALQGLIFNIVNGTIPGVGKLLGLQEYSKVSKIWSNTNNLIFLLTAAAGVTIILFNHSFLKAWVGSGHYAGNIANALIIVMIIQDLFIRHDGFIITATLDLRKKVFFTLRSLIVFIGLGIFLINSFGISGLCISLIVSKFFLFIAQRNILKAKIKNGFNYSVFSNLQPLLITLGMLGGAYFLATMINSVSFIEMLGLVPITFLVSFFVFYKLGLNKEKRTELIQIISSLKLFKSNEKRL